MYIPTPKNQPMKVVFICHPVTSGPDSILSNNLKNNHNALVKLIDELKLKYKNYVFIVPTFTLSYLSSDNEEEELLARISCFELIRRSDEMWIFGDYKNSRGCMAEINFANELRMVIKYE